jgi:hypothetical protein
MKKKSLITLGTIATGSSFSLLGCSNDFNASMNHNMDVYGPAIQEESTNNIDTNNVSNDVYYSQDNDFATGGTITPIVERTGNIYDNSNQNEENLKENDEYYTAFLPNENELICMYGPAPTTIVTPKPTNTPTVKPTSMPTPTSTPTPTIKPTSTPTSIPTPTIKPTSTPTPTTIVVPEPVLPIDPPITVMYGPAPTTIVTPEPVLPIDPPITVMYGPMYDEGVFEYKERN